jgi:hypothetical protein
MDHGETGCRDVNWTEVVDFCEDCDELLGSMRNLLIRSLTVIYSKDP